MISPRITCLIPLVIALFCSLETQPAVECLPAESQIKDDDVSTLAYLQFLHRHGDRSPVAIYPTDPYDASYWPRGLGELTKKGIRRMYEVGRFLRQRYTGFLNNSFYDNQINVKSTDVPRALMSAEALLAGLYPPEDSEIWNKQLLWQPIPVHIDNRLLKTDGNCPRYNIAFDKLQIQAFNRGFQSQFINLCDYLRYETRDSSFDASAGGMCLKEASDLYDNLFCEDNEGFVLPDWTATVYPDPLKQINDWKFVYSYYTTEMAKLKSGYLLYNVVDNIRKFVNGELESLRVQHYSAHDSTVAPFMSLLGINNKIAPPFSATLLMELHRDPVNEYVIKFFYYNDTETAPYTIQLPNCDFACPLNDFYRITEPLVVDDPEKECRTYTDAYSVLYM